MAKPSRAVLEKRCRFGILKNPIKTRSGRIRYCKYNPAITARRISSALKRKKKK